MVDYYKVLGVTPNATQVEIKKAFKEKALAFHPDRNPDDPYKEELFKEINDAYQTLSNPYSRSNYDLMLRHGSDEPHVSSSSYRSPPPPWAFRQRPVVHKQKFTSKENLRATLYAFLFAFVVAVIVKTTIYFVERHREAELAELLLERRNIFDQIVREKEQGNLAASLSLLEDMAPFYFEEGDIREFKDQLVYDIRDAADYYLERQEFEKAVSHYEILSEYSIGSTINYMLKMAKAYQGMGNYHETLKIYQVLRMYGYSNASFFYDMGLLYEAAGNLDQALRHYQLGVERAAAEYEVTIGKAYPVVINAGMIPSHHYFIYLKVAEMNYAIKDYQEAIKSLAWPREIWPDSLRLHEIEANSYEALDVTNDSGSVFR